MAVALRLQRRGQTKRPFYRIVATTHDSRRDGRYLEVVGTYNPMVNPAQVSLKEDRVKHWVSTGAKQSDIVRSLIRKNIPGLIEAKEEIQKEKLQAR